MQLLTVGAMPREDTVTQRLGLCLALQRGPDHLF